MLNPISLYRHWLMARGYKKLAKQLAKDPIYAARREALIARREMIAERLKRQDDA